MISVREVSCIPLAAEHHCSMPRAASLLFAFALLACVRPPAARTPAADSTFEGAAATRGAAITPAASSATGTSSPPSAGSPSELNAAPGLARGIAIADSLVSAAAGTLVPGAVLLVARNGEILHERAYGHARLTDAAGRPLAEPHRMTTSTLFDLASVTKVMATTMAVMLLVDRGELALDAPVGRYLPEFRGPRLDSITVRHLLTHSSGLVQWQPLYYQAPTASETYRAILGMPLGWGVGEGRRYSDLGFMLLGYLVERVAGRPLDAFVQEELYRPLGLRATTFSPRARGLREFAATERGNAYERRMVHDSTFGYRYLGDPAAWNGWRDYVLDGEVNDGNAWYAHDGVAGHAGLFSTASELRVLIDLLNERGTHGGRRFLSAAVVDTFLTRDRHGHYLGWMYPRDMPEGSFAHNGFTGTYVLGIPGHRLSVVLLTNRQHFGTNERGYFADLGPLVRAVSVAILRGAEAER